MGKSVLRIAEVAFLLTAFIVFSSGCACFKEAAIEEEPPMEKEVAVVADSDGDGVPDELDRCPDTPKDVEVDSQGCPPDTDGDGVFDYMDKCPGTPKGVAVDTKGCPLDTDKDGIYDYMDKCWNTPMGAEVDEKGCWDIGNVLFDTDKHDIKSQYYSILDEVVTVMKNNPSLTLEVEGHTDNIGSAKYNQNLSMERAISVVGYLVSKGIDKLRLQGSGYGPSKPAASNDTAEGRAQNRRVELKPIR
jgi:OOP family OmpA-OmpF porin